MRMLTRLVVASSGLLLLVAQRAVGDTPISGNITTSTTWTVAGSPYVVTGAVWVGGSPTPTLTINAGVTVKFNSAASLIINYSTGVLIANGTSASPILLTANGSTAPGFWGGLYLGGASPTPSQLTYTTVEYSGYAPLNRGGIHIENGSPTLTNVTVRNNVIGGITVNGGSPTITGGSVTGNAGPGISVSTGTASVTGTTITGNTGYAISAAPNGVLSGLTGLTVSGNGPGKDFIERQGGQMSTSQTWVKGTVPYAMTGSVTTGGTPPTLTIAAGVTVKVSANANLVVGWPGQGSLIANGTAASPILLTANGSTTPGFWTGVYIGAGPVTSQMSYVTVEYAGTTSPYQRGGVYVENASPTLDHVTSRNNVAAGMTLNGGSSTVTASTVTGNSGPGITVLLGTASITGTTASSNTGAGIDVTADSAAITTCTLTSNTGYAISAAPSAILTGLTGLTVSGNGPGKDYIERRGGGMAVSQTWVKGTVPYAMTGSVTSVGTPPTLTIAAGVTVKASAGANLVLGWPGQGTLIANGTAASPILLTANGSTTPGFWTGVYLGNAPTQSQMSYVTVEYAGTSGYTRGGIYVENASPTLDHVTSRNNIVAGITLNGGSSSVTNSTLTANSGPGITVTNGSATITGATASGNSGAGIDVSGTSAAITTCTLTGNTGYAISAAPSSVLTGLTGLTVSGNGPGKDYIERRGGGMSVSQTWIKGTVPYAMTGSVTTVGTPPTLTIAAGVTVKASAGANLVVGWPGQGTLIANGTAASPILLTANGSTTPGFWAGVYIGNAPTQSQMSYVTVEYGGWTPNNRGGIYIENASPTIHHVTVRNSAVAGMTVNGGLPVLTNNSFTGNVAGLINQVPSIPIVARYHYWGAANGPSGSGPGTGQSVSTGVSFEPWLTAAGSQPNYYNSFTQKNRTFNPAIGVNTTITGGTVQSGNWTFTILNSVGATVRTFTGTGTSGTMVWDGKNQSGTDQPDGTYNYQLASTSTGGNVATPIRGLSIIDRTKQIAVSNLAVSLPFFSPNADTVQDTTTVSGSNSFDDTTFTINVKKTGGTIVRTNVSVGLTFAYAWDGKNGSGVVQADGLYTFEVIATNGSASSTSTITTTLDNTLPTASITAPLNGAVLSNIYTNGVTDVAVTGSNADANFNNWVSDFGLGSNPSTFTGLSSGSAPVTNGSLGTWVTAPLTNGLYTLRLRAWDKAGNVKTVTVQPTVGNFSVAQSARQLNVAAAESINYTSIVPFALNETLVVKNAAGTVVRTLLNAAPQVAGTVNTPWNGKTAANGAFPDGPYFYVATVTAGTYTFVWDLTTKYWNDTNGYNDSLGIQPWDPFNNRPMTFSYNFGTPGRIYIALSQNGPVPTNCTPPTYCLANGDYEESGPHTRTWAGVDSTGALRGDLRHIGVVTQTFAFSKNALVVYGTKPAVTNVTVTPPVYGPAVGSQTIALDLTLYQLTPTTITIKFQNQASLSVLRTLTFPSQTAGHKTYTWDGKADNGMWVAPGFYTVTVTASDAAGNSVSSQILTTIQY